MAFIYVGRLDEIKGIKILFQAWKQMGANAPELNVCGTGTLEDWCKEYISQNNLTMISMLGFVPNTEAKRLIADSEALILPTQWYEGFPMTVLEAYSVGTPVIASDMGNAGSMVEERITGCKFQHDSVEELAYAVKRLSSYKDIYQTVALEYKCRYTAAENYEILIDIYREVTEMNTAPIIRGGGIAKQ